MRGRKPPGPEFVQRLEGNQDAKQRLEVILQTIAGQVGVNEASASLGVTPQRFHMLRAQGLQAAVEALTARPSGRPRQTPTPESERLRALAEENACLRRELAASQLREEIALLLPGRPGRGEKKSGVDTAERTGAGRRRRH